MERKDNKTNHSGARHGRTAVSDTLPHIGQQIKLAVHERQLSGAWLASRLGCDRTNVYKMFKRPTIDTLMLLRVSFILGVDFFELYTREVHAAIGHLHAHVPH